MLSKDRKLYDLCRKYKYYYKAFKEIEHLKNVYWSKYIQEAYKDAKQKLEDIEKEIKYLVFDDLIGDNSRVDFERDVQNIHSWNMGSVPIVKGLKVTLYDELFVKELEEYLNKKHIRIYRNF